ncbi:MAG: co-chaperone GroES [Parcubacteria group bacterium]|nr:co-chaperone GroES [Parcubacteria group bacterium]|tara:strand:+ start:500 stop:790 length:291 start_codon:yes stop_codon:yes gene_type:complete
MNITPLHDKVVIKAITKDETTASGIILPDTVDQGRPEQGEVISVGPGRVLDNGSLSKMSVQPGQKVLFKKYAPDEIKIDKEEYLVVADSDILAVIN